jgi:hypothetical protein
VLQIVRSTLRLYAHRWPALVAIFLAGWIANYLLIRFGGFVANIDPLYGQLVLPLAVLARVASYVAMFLVLRPGKPFAEALASSVLPFLIVFATWGLIKDDWVAFSIAQLEQRDFGAENEVPLFIGVTPVTITVVVVAFVLRFVLKRFASKLPRWVSFVAAYLEAVWIFIALDVIGQLLAGVPQWLQTRRIVVWVTEVVESLKDAFAPVRWLADAAAWLIDRAGTVIGLPLAWLTLAGIVYAVTIVARTPTGVTAAATKRWGAIPGFLRKRMAELAADLGGRWTPISSAVRLIWRAGIVTMALFVLAYAVLDTSTLWISFGINRMLGPHELQWWASTDTAFSLLIDLLVEPLRLSLIAATWAYCLTRSEPGRTELESEGEEGRELVTDR